jgi:hypothetical protein
VREDSLIPTRRDYNISPRQVGADFFNELLTQDTRGSAHPSADRCAAPKFDHHVLLMDFIAGTQHRERDHQIRAHSLSVSNAANKSMGQCMMIIRGRQRVRR